MARRHQVGDGVGVTDDRGHFERALGGEAREKAKADSTALKEKIERLNAELTTAEAGLDTLLLEVFQEMRVLAGAPPAISCCTSGADSPAGLPAPV